MNTRTESSLSIAALSYSSVAGGAARTAYRIHQMMNDGPHTSTLYIQSGPKLDPLVVPPATKMLKAVAVARNQLGRQLLRLQRSENRILHSGNFLPSSWPQFLNRNPFSAVHLHWINGEMLSIADIARIRKPVVWTLHDMWTFCGAEHISYDCRFKEGYTHSNRPPSHRGVDLDRLTWRKKMNRWRSPRLIITPSRWMHDCAKESKLLERWPVMVIPNPINTDEWRPFNKYNARDLLDLPQDRRTVVFGSAEPGTAPHKGLDLLQEALHLLSGEQETIAPFLVTLGASDPSTAMRFRCKHKHLGNLQDVASMRACFSAADAVIVPSRLDNFPNMAVEALACGAPVIGFNICGLPEIVTHKKTGYLASPFSTQDLAAGIKWVLSTNLESLRENARASAARFSYSAVRPQYEAAYAAATEMFRGKPQKTPKHLPQF